MRPPSSIEDELGVEFSDLNLLELALTHSSYLNENPGIVAESNERLEFLGDAVLGCIVANDLYQGAPGRPEGDLTALRSDIVKGETLAQIASELRLGQFLVMGKGEESSGGRDRASNLAAAYEALLGAIFLDCGYDAARDFVIETLSGKLVSAPSRTIHKNPKSTLQELVQKDGSSAPTYRVIRVTGEDHLREFTVEVVVSGNVIGRGSGRRKSSAEGEAALEALRALEQAT